MEVPGVYLLFGIAFCNSKSSLLLFKRKQLENSMMIPVAEKIIKKLKVFQCVFF